MWKRPSLTLGIGLSATTVCGCERAPSIDVLGSFFPIWPFCLLAGIVLTVGTRLVLVRVRLDSEIGPVVIVYPSLVALFAFTIWLVCFHY